MKHSMLALALLVAGSVCEARPGFQDTPGEETREVRIYILDRTMPERSVKDAAAVLTLSRKSGRGQTILFPRALKEAPPLPEGAAPGMIRSLISSPYFIELDLGDAATAPCVQDSEKRAAPAEEEEAGDAAAPLSSQEVLRRARKGTWFSRKLPASAFSEPFTATVTIRIGTLSFSSEEFQGPRSAHETPEDAAARIDQSLQNLQDRAKDSGRFMDLKPVSDELIRDLSKLAPAGFEDVSGEIERQRQWCLALARAIEDSCYSGNTARIQELCQQSGPRMKDVHELLANRRKGEPVPTPAAPETPPTVK
jgi:hypothetical protein